MDLGTIASALRVLPFAALLAACTSTACTSTESISCVKCDAFGTSPAAGSGVVAASAGAAGSDDSAAEGGAVAQMIPGAKMEADAAVDAGPVLPTELTVVGQPNLCRLSADNKRLIVTVKNAGSNSSAPTITRMKTLDLELQDQDIVLEQPTPALAAGTSIDLSFERGPLLGFSANWNFEITLDTEHALPDGSVAEPTTGVCQGPRARAAAAIAALQEFYDVPAGLWQGEHGGEWWKSANALEATIDYSRFSGDRSYLSDIATTFDKNGGDGFLNEYYDDEGWWALALIKAFDVTHDARYLERAKAIFDDMKLGWSEQCGGGLFWRKQNDYKNAISNELFMVVGARLHLRSADDAGPGSTLDWAQRAYEWFKASGLLGGSHQIVDGLNSETCAPQGPVYTYNQGVILGGLIDLWRATANEQLLHEAVAIADASLEHLRMPEGVLQEPGCDVTLTCDGDTTQFKGIFMRYAGYLYEALLSGAAPASVETAFAGFGATLHAFLLLQADALWDLDRNAFDQFGSRYSGPFDEADMSRQSSALDAFNAAILAGNPNLALGRPAAGASPCSSNETVDRALDGSAAPGSKWCSAGLAGQTLQVDLQAPRPIVGFVVRHAGAGGEDPAYNTRDFVIETSADQSSWSPAVTIGGNTAYVSTLPVLLISARFVRLKIENAQSIADNPAARIFEFEVLGASF